MKRGYKKNKKGIEGHLQDGKNFIWGNSFFSLEARYAGRCCSGIRSFWAGTFRVDPNLTFKCHHKAPEASPTTQKLYQLNCHLKTVFVLEAVVNLDKQTSLPAQVASERKWSHVSKHITSIPRMWWRASPLLSRLLRWAGSLLTPHTPALSEKPVSSSQLAAFSRDTDTLTAAISDPAYRVKVLFLALLMTPLSLLLLGWETTRTESRQHYCRLESSWQRLRGVETWRPTRQGHLELS